MLGCCQWVKGVTTETYLSLTPQQHSESDRLDSEPQKDTEQTLCYCREEIPELSVTEAFGPHMSVFV